METKDLAQQAKETAAEAANAAKATAHEHVEDAKASVANTVADEARSWRAAAAELDADTFTRHAADHLADRLSNAASAVRSTDLSRIRSDVEDFARQNPLVFFGASALAGFALGRVLKASERAEHDGQSGIHDDMIPAGQRAYPGHSRRPTETS